MESGIEARSLPLTNPDLVISWLSTVNDDWVDSNYAQPLSFLPKTITTTTTATPTPSSSVLSRHHPSPPRRSSSPARKRRRLYSNSSEMDRDSETASNASASSSRTTTTSPISLRNRPILNPTPPSTRHRSPSPTRKVLSQLRYATPSLRVCQPDVRVVEPSMVRDLTSMLVKELTGGVIPMGLKVYMDMDFQFFRFAMHSQLTAELYSLDFKESTPISSRSQARAPSSNPIRSNIHPHTSLASGARPRRSTTMHVLAMTIFKTKAPG